VTDKRNLTFSTKLAYGFGAVAFGVKNNGFDYFLLIFYSQVMGVDAPLVGLALIVDCPDF
jgi:Na+/melibiose symporter-like transporter